MGLLRVMGPEKGDEHLEWDPDDKESVKQARKRFEQLVKPEAAGKGAVLYRAYKVEHEPRQGDPIDEFDPSAGEILLVPAMQGG